MRSNGADSGKATSVHENSKNDCSFGKRKVFDPRSDLSGFESRDEGLERKKALIRILLTGEDHHHHLGTVLSLCETGSRCGLSICPFCMRRFRARFLIPEVCAQIARWQERTGESGVAASVVPARLKLAPGELDKLNLGKMLDVFRQQLRRSGYGDCISVAGVDLSFNEDSDNQWAPHWQPHLYAVVLSANEPKQVKAELGTFFPVDESVRVPVLAKRLNEPMRPVSYLWKPFFQRRVSYIAANGRLAARKLPLRPDQVREVVSYFADKAPCERLLFMGIRRRGQHLAEV